MNELLKAMKKAGDNVMMPSPPDEIDKSLFEKLPALEMIYEAYCSEENLKDHKKVIISLLHALVVQQKLAFGLTRLSLQNIAGKDPNWDDKPSRTSEDYPKICAVLQNLGIRRVVKANRNKAGIFVVDDTCLMNKG